VIQQTVMQEPMTSLDNCYQTLLQISRSLGHSEHMNRFMLCLPWLFAAWRPSAAIVVAQLEQDDATGSKSAGGINIATRTLPMLEADAAIHACLPTVLALDAPLQRMHSALTAIAATSTVTSPTVSPTKQPMSPAASNALVSWFTGAKPSTPSSAMHHTSTSIISRAIAPVFQAVTRLIEGDVNGREFNAAKKELSALVQQLSTSATMTQLTGLRYESLFAKIHLLAALLNEQVRETLPSELVGGLSAVAMAAVGAPALMKETLMCNSPSLIRTMYSILLLFSSPLAPSVRDAHVHVAHRKIRPKLDSQENNIVLMPGEDSALPSFAIVYIPAASEEDLQRSAVVLQLGITDTEDLDSLITTTHITGQPVRIDAHDLGAEFGLSIDAEPEVAAAAAVAALSFLLPAASLPSLMSDLDARNRLQYSRQMVDSATSNLLNSSTTLKASTIIAVHGTLGSRFLQVIQQIQEIVSMPSNLKPDLFVVQDTLRLLRTSLHLTNARMGDIKAAIRIGLRTQAESSILLRYASEASTATVLQRVINDVIASETSNHGLLSVIATAVLSAAMEANNVVSVAAAQRMTVLAMQEASRVIADDMPRRLLFEDLNKDALQLACPMVAGSGSGARGKRTINLTRPVNRQLFEELQARFNDVISVLGLKERASTRRRYDRIFLDVTLRIPLDMKMVGANTSTDQLSASNTTEATSGHATTAPADFLAPILADIASAMNRATSLLPRSALVLQKIAAAEVLAQEIVQGIASSNSADSYGHQIRAITGILQTANAELAALTTKRNCRSSTPNRGFRPTNWSGGYSAHAPTSC
jgi:hypothetical protein